MLSYILRIMQEFERTYGRHPQVICLNPRHMRQLLDECPNFFSVDRPIPLGFRVKVMPESTLPHPKALWVPPRAPAARRRPARRKPRARK